MDNLKKDSLLQTAVQILGFSQTPQRNTIQTSSLNAGSSNIGSVNEVLMKVGAIAFTLIRSDAHSAA
ncbi:hypothetical protein PN4B1_14600 [Paenibacillus naphthalenovorans]|uniref:hypothetical protein n=1 Tax=Paenibacillus naphthalenovorans TaxID=162209 RepID=UPI0010B7EB7D|nr:hypothetical protein [Paenibacillus naphthalenovorans]GCL71555.1 hypothetical protein PN4B1_14600 [Paenibacillus naphthalenovorans]